jgi:predicted secreted protein
MGPSFAFFTFLNAFWIMAFIAIPFSTEYEQVGEKKENNYNYAAAPKKIYWKKVVTIAAILAIIITAGIALVIKSGIIPLKNL